MPSKLAIVVPSIRPESLSIFMEKWRSLFEKYNPEIFVVKDGENPEVKSLGSVKKIFTHKEIMGEYEDLIYNKNDGVRNLGFALIHKSFPQVEYIYTLDDDVYPNGNDPIAEHLTALQARVPVSWISTASRYMRGFPYGIRDEAEVVLSHGVWANVADYDAPTQLVNGNLPVTFYKGAIPKGIYYPMCIMNVMFKRKLLPWMYQAPMGYRVGFDRFADIWSGIVSKRAIDENGWAVVSGYSTIWHDRASNVFVNLKKEAPGLPLNEGFYKGEESDPYFQIYKDQLARWQEFLKK